MYKCDIIVPINLFSNGVYYFKRFKTGGMQAAYSWAVAFTTTDLMKHKYLKSAF